MQLPVPADISLLCLPCAGASATMYGRWRRLLPEWIRIVPVELPGRGARLADTPVTNFDALVTHICSGHAVAMQGRYALLGHSMGALLAYGVARRLRQTGRRLPLALFVSGSPAPSRRDPDYFTDKNNDAALIEDLRRQGGTPEEVFEHRELLRITLDVLAADYRVCESFRHVHEAPLPMPVHAYAGREDDIEAGRIAAWAEETAGAFTLDWFDGGHFFIRQHEREVLAALLRRMPRSIQHRGAR